MGVQAQNTYSLIIQNKSSCDVDIQLQYCSGAMSVSMSCPAFDSASNPIPSEPKMYEGTFDGDITLPFNGTFDSNCPSASSSNPSPDACYTGNVGSITNQTSPTHTDFYVILY